MDIQQYLKKFFDYLLTERCVAQNTLLAYQRDIAQFMDFIQKTTAASSFEQITSQNIKDFLKYLRYDLQVTPKSSSRKLSALKTLSGYLFKYYDLTMFTNGVAFPQLPKQLPKYISQEQVKNLLTTAAQDSSALGYRNQLMICLLYACGMRVSELVSLRLSQISLQEKCIKVLGKGGKERIIPLPDELIVMIQRYIDHTHGYLLGNYGRRFKISVIHQRSTDFLFPVVYAGKIGHITRHAFWRILKEIARESGLLHDISPHVLRHSLATHMLKRGANLRVLQVLLGHEKINTVQVYTHLDILHLRTLYDQYHPRA